MTSRQQPEHQGGARNPGAPFATMWQQHYADLWQEHADHEMGAASEAQNCFREAQEGFAEQLGEADTEIQLALEAGMFVVVVEVAVHCRATDAVVGVLDALHAAFRTREEAEVELRRLYATYLDGGSRWRILPQVQAAEPATPRAEDLEDVFF